jgi:hypothetical protein
MHAIFAWLIVWIKVVKSKAAKNAGHSIKAPLLGLEPPHQKPVDPILKYG